MRAGYLRALPGCNEERVQVGGQECHILACTVLKNKGESARSTNTRNGRREKVESNSFRKLTEFAIQARFDNLELLLPGCPIVPGLERHKEKSVVTSAGEA